LVTIAVASIPGWLAYLAKVRETRTEEKRISSDAGTALTDDLLANLRYKDEQIRDLRDQLITVDQRDSTQIISLQSQCKELVDENYALSETLDKAVERIAVLEWVERGYKLLVEYAQGLERAIAQAGISWETITTTRLMALNEWEGGPHVDLVGDLEGELGDSKVVNKIRREIQASLQDRNL